MTRARTTLSLSALLVVACTALIAPAAVAAPAAPRAVATARASSTPLARAQSWAWHEYGSFTVITVHGSGDDVIALPKHLRAAAVSASTNGQENFAVETLDSKNHEHDLLVNTIGAYSGTDAFGLYEKSTATKLQITADGDWTVTIRPIWRAALLPSSHTGDGVYLADHAAGSMRFTNAGSGNFAVEQHTGHWQDQTLLVNEIGHYSGTVPVAGGPSVFVVTSDGRWTATRR